jgi:hypothetical protein
MRNSLFHLVLIFFVAGSVAAQTADWRIFKYSAGNFSVLVPADPKDTPSANPDAMITVEASLNGIGYAVIYVHDAAQNFKVDEANARQFGAGIIKLQNCTVSTESPADPPVPALAGLHYRLACENSGAKFTYVGNIYIGKHYGYFVMGIFATAASDPPEVKKFVDSFSILDPNG